MSDTKDTTRPMTAEEYWKDKFPVASENNLVLGFADAYATYRLQFERRQHQNSWMPTEEEWKRLSSMAIVVDIFKVSVSYYDVPSPVVLIAAEPDATPYKAKDAA